MRAAIVRAHGGPENLEIGEAPRPEPAPGEILVRVGACALNHLDVFVRRGIPGHELPVPYVPGADVAGWVEDAGDAGGKPLVGLPVLLDPFVDGGALGESRAGGMAEFVVLPTANAIPLPPEPGDLARFAALPVAYGTAWKMLFRRACLKPEETVVVVSATGGVGVACVQLAATQGSRVIACTGSPDKSERLRSIGADEVVAGEEAFSGAVRELTGGRGADVVVDFTGKATWPETIRSARRDGRVVTCGATSGPEVRMDQRYVFWRELSILGSNGWVREDLVRLVELVADDELDPIVHRIVPLDDAPEAFADLEERRAFGKVVVRVTEG